jgi:hypothetical protein
VGSLSNPVATSCGVHEPSPTRSVLIGADGKVIATGLFHDQIGKTVGGALGRE